jgi:hypothetical protein
MKQQIRKGMACMSAFGPLRIAIRQDPPAQFFVTLEEPGSHRGQFFQETITATLDAAKTYIIDKAKEYLAKRGDEADHREAWECSEIRI